jgi:two-component system NtrC family sensor kinase
VSPAESTGRVPARDRHILVVDDEPGVVEVLTEMLEMDGYQVDSAPNGVVALDKLRTHAFDVILCDLRMPELDGPGLYQELERLDPERSRRMIFLTGGATTPGMVEFLERTRAFRLSKPCVLAELREVVQQVVG